MKSHSSKNIPSKGGACWESSITKFSHNQKSPFEGGFRGMFSSINEIPFFQKTSLPTSLQKGGACWEVQLKNLITIKKSPFQGGFRGMFLPASTSTALSTSPSKGGACW